MHCPSARQQHTGQCPAAAVPRQHDARASARRQQHVFRPQHERSAACCRAHREGPSTQLSLALLPLSTLLLDAGAASAATDFSKGSYAVESYWASLGLFIISFPGLWSQIKRAPKAKRVRKTYEVAGPGVPDAPSADSRARSIFSYFKKYNYTVAETGEVITFQGMYKASTAQAAALVFYVFCGLASLALVLSVALPFGGNYWYALAGLSPLAGAYYWSKGTRKEDFKVKMVMSDDEQTTDIVVEGDDEEAERLRKEMGFAEKGNVYVKGLLENFAGEN